MIEGSCHCGAVQWTFEGVPESATACNCTVCRRSGVLWAYGYDGENIKTSGETKVYFRADQPPTLGFHFCEHCGCVAYWRSTQPNEQGRHRIAVNLRMAEPEPVANIPIRHFEGLIKFEALPMDGRCVADYWF